MEIMIFLREHQLNIMLALAFCCGLLSLFSFIQLSTSKVRKNTLLCMSICSMILLISDRQAYIFRGNTTSIGFIMTRASNFLVFLMSLVIILAFNWYLIDYFDKNLKTTFRRLTAANEICYSAIVLLVISQFTDLYYYFDENNFYHRSNCFILCYILPLVILIIQLTVIIQKYHCFRKRMFYPLLFFAMVPLIASIAQVFLYGISLTNISIVGLVILLRVFEVLDINKEIVEAHKSETEILKDKNEIAKAMVYQSCEALASAVDAKDEYTNGHSKRVAEYSAMIAENAGKSEEECEKIYIIAIMHDVGKIGIPGSVIKKETRLSDEEFDLIKQHTTIGNEILSKIKSFPELSVGAHYHHERYDGKGYPEGLKGEKIPEIARIIAVADAYDAMTSNRSYRNAIPQHIVREELVKGIGTQFDPEFAKIMIHIIDLDIEYKMKESISGANVTAKNPLRCNSIYNDCTEGIGVTTKKTIIKFCSQPDDNFCYNQSLPTLIVFDALDGQVHPGENNNKDLLYHEYAKIRLDGHVTELGIRNSEIIMHDEESNIQYYNLRKPESEQHYRIETVRNRDHVLLKVSTPNQIFDVILALPDTSRYVFISISGENCEIHNIMVDTEKVDTDPNSIPRIAEEISYIKNCPVGDLPNIEIDGPRLSSTEGIPIYDNMTLILTFHSMSYPTARLVWHCPYFCLFSSANGQVDGDNFKEFLLLKINGENWESPEKVVNRVNVKQMKNFEGWNSWIEKNKQGIDCIVNITRKGNKIMMNTQNLDISINSVTTIQDGTDDIYFAITGDQCAITNIKMQVLQNHI